MLLYIKFTKAGYFNLKTKTVKTTKYNSKSGYLKVPTLKISIMNYLKLEYLTFYLL